MQMRGKVRFRFRSSESEIDVLIEGEYDVVNSIRDELGLQGRVGFIQPLSARLVHGHEPELSPAMGDEEDLENLSDENKLPGPPPDPTSIPAVVRRIGDLDIKADFSKYRLGAVGINDYNGFSAGMDYGEKKLKVRLVDVSWMSQKSSDKPTKKARNLYNEISKNKEFEKIKID